MDNDNKIHEPPNHYTIDATHLQSVIDILARQGYSVIAPVKKNNVIAYDEITSVTELPAGWGEEQEAATYRLKRRDDNAYFGYNLGPHSWKEYLYPKKETLFSAQISKKTFTINDENENTPKMAFVGVRPCELKAIEIQDKVFIEGKYPDPRYQKRREDAFIIVAQCTQAATTCFCTSMGTGPKADNGFDMAITEVMAGKIHFLVITGGSVKGDEIIAELAGQNIATVSTEAEIKAARNAEANAISNIHSHFNTEGIKELLQSSLEHDHWSEISKRCLSCANCTMVCPTCFCSTVEDTISLDGSSAERIKTWDSCFNPGFSYIHGGSIRNSISSKYRQWLTHKLANWEDQFGSSGCVGCGRCITWCPAGIDLRELGIRNGTLTR